MPHLRRLHVTFGPRTVRALTSLRDNMEARELVEAVRFAIEMAADIASRIRAGDRFIVRASDGTERELIVPGLTAGEPQPRVARAPRGRTAE